MPERTPIMAARAGVVIDIENFHVRGGKEQDLLDKANSVTVLHEDGTMARYVHLNAGQYTWIGQEVQAGTHIGYSGNTGYLRPASAFRGGPGAAECRRLDRLRVGTDTLLRARSACCSSPRSRGCS